MLTRTLAADVTDPRFAAVSLRPGVLDTDMQTRARSQSPDEFPAVAMFRAFHADRRLVAPDVAAAKFADKIVLAPKLANGATYAWPDLDKPVAERRRAASASASSAGARTRASAFASSSSEP